MRKIAIYGKGGIGKSTTAANLSVALAERGYRVMQIGCDPKADSTRSLTGWEKMPTVLDAIREKGDDIQLSDIVIEGEKGVLCVEAGGPTPGIGCAGRGIITAFEKLQKLNAYEVFVPDFVIYDVLGDVVCGGFAMPIRGGYADSVFVVTSGEKMSLYAAGNIAAAVSAFRGRGYAAFSGLILNARNVAGERAAVERLAAEIGSRVIQRIRRHGDIQKAETMRKTVMAAFPQSPVSAEYRALAGHVLSECGAEGAPDMPDTPDTWDTRDTGQGKFSDAGPF
jgi:nitrogenase iron protein NifH